MAISKDSTSASGSPHQFGWHKLLEGYPWFRGEGQFYLPAYSEFMPPPRVGQSPYESAGPDLFSERDAFGWLISEIEEEYELQPGLEHLSRLLVGQIAQLGQGLPAHHIAGHGGRNLVNNPYWPPELAARAGHLPHERYVVILPLALSRTQDDKGSVRWTFFGGSEQGPERAFWKSSYTAPGEEVAGREPLTFIVRLLKSAYSEEVEHPSKLHAAGFRILPTETEPALPGWCQPYLLADHEPMEKVRYLLTFRPFGRLPADIRARYLAGDLALLPFPGSLVFWGMPTYLRLQTELPLAQQIPLQRLVERRNATGGLRVPQSGWLYEPHAGLDPADVQKELLRATYHRTHRWQHVQRYEDDLALNPRMDPVAKVLFSTSLDSLGLYGKPMARNVQIWTKDFALLLDGPNATRQALERAEEALIGGGLFGYRFQFPAMRVGHYEVYWQRPLIAYLNPKTKEAALVPEAPVGYLTAYRARAARGAHATQEVETLDLHHPVELWPRLLRREPYLLALRRLTHIHDHYEHQTAFNTLSLMDAWEMLGQQPLPRSFARALLRIAKHETLEAWLAALPERASDPEAGRRLQDEIEKRLEPPGEAPSGPALTYGETASRAFEEAYWKDIATLAHGRFLNKDNADTVKDPVTQGQLAHHQRDLEHLGDYLLRRHRQAIAEVGLEGKALCGELPFEWRTDFDYALFGGWKLNQDGRTYERDLLVVIPGKDRRQAVVLADHYDTAYMEDVFEKERGGSGARLSAPGADDNDSATATLLQAAPLFLKLAREGKLERDVWLLHLTGEEFPADSMGARHFCKALVEKTLKLKVSETQSVDLSHTQVVGVLVMDMIAHNRENAQDIFQISPGRSPRSVRLAWQAHLANQSWNAIALAANGGPERRGRGRGRRSPDGATIPELAAYLPVHGEVRTQDDPASSIFNTDGVIFSDIGAPVVLFMENYDINRRGYHDSLDTLANIDLDYGAALAATAIETIARVATAPEM